MTEHAHAHADASDVPLEALFDAHCDFVWRSLRHLGVHESTLDDAVQDVFVIAHARWSSFRGESTPRTWLFGIARRVAWRHRRAANVHAWRHVAHAHAPEPTHEPFERVHAVQSLARLLGRLDRDKRAVFVLAELEGFTAPEVSRALGIPLGTAYSRLRAAWQSLGTTAAREQQRVRSTLAIARRDAPSRERRGRMWSAIAAGLPSAAPLGAAGLGAAITGAAHGQAWTVVIVALGLGLGGAAVLASRDDSGARTASAAPHEPASRASANAAPRDATAERTSPNAAPHEHAPSDARVAASQRAELAPPAAPRSNDAARRPPDDVHDRTREPAPTSTPTPTPTPTPVVEPDALAQELALVRAAKQALSRARPDDALASLREHARRFPEGQLAADRDALVSAAEKMQGAAIDRPASDTSAAEELDR